MKKKGNTKGKHTSIGDHMSQRPPILSEEQTAELYKENRKLKAEIASLKRSINKLAFKHY